MGIRYRRTVSPVLVFSFSVVKRHAQLLQGQCIPASTDEECRLVDGLSSILMDGVLDIASWAFDIVDHAFDDSQMLNQFATPPLTGAQFLRRTGADVVPLGDSDNNIVTTTRSVPTSLLIVSLVSVVLLIVVLLCSMTSIHSFASKRKKNTSTRAYLQDDVSNPVVEGENQSHAANQPCWSDPMQRSTVSDITSESKSLESMKSAKKMRRIDEVPCDESEHGLSDDEESQNGTLVQRAEPGTMAQREDLRQCMKNPPCQEGLGQTAAAHVVDMHFDDSDVCRNQTEGFDKVNEDDEMLLGPNLDDSGYDQDIESCIVAGQVGSCSGKGCWCAAGSKHLTSLPIISDDASVARSQTSVQSNTSHSFWDVSALSSSHSKGSLGTLSGIRSFWAPSPRQLHRSEECEPSCVNQVMVVEENRD